MDRPVYFTSRWKSIQTDHPETKRYAHWRSILSVVSADQVQKTKEICNDWEEKEKNIWKLGTLKYKKKIVHFPPGIIR